MAIKPDDCVIRIEDLVVGTKEITDWDGRPRQVPRYEQYWENFCRHTDDLKTKVKWNAHSKDPWQHVVDDELAKYGAIFKRTKQYRNNYVKFKSHKHLTMFIMRWS